MGTSLDNSVSAENEGEQYFPPFFKQENTKGQNIFLTIGIVPRCIIDLFRILKDRAAQESDFKYEVYVSFLELYNEEFIDLLNPQSNNKRRGYAPPTSEVSIREDTAGNIFWSGVREEICYSPEELLG